MEVALISTLCDNNHRIAADVCGLSLRGSDASGLSLFSALLSFAFHFY